MSRNLSGPAAGGRQRASSILEMDECEPMSTSHRTSGVTAHTQPGSLKPTVPTIVVTNAEPNNGRNKQVDFVEYEHEGPKRISSQKDKSTDEVLRSQSAIESDSASRVRSISLEQTRPKLAQLKARLSMGNILKHDSTDEDKENNPNKANQERRKSSVRRSSRVFESVTTMLARRVSVQGVGASTIVDFDYARRGSRLSVISLGEGSQDAGHSPPSISVLQEEDDEKEDSFRLRSLSCNEFVEPPRTGVPSPAPKRRRSRSHQDRFPKRQESLEDQTNRIIYELNDIDEAIDANGGRNDSVSSKSPLQFEPLEIDLLSGDPKAIEETKKRIWRSVIAISLGFLLLFSCISGLAALQSTLNSNESLGVIGMCVNFSMVVVSCLLVPHAVIKWLGYKWTMVTMMGGFIPWIAANLYPVWGTIIPASLLMGLVWAPLWTAHSSYITILAKAYAEMTNSSTQIIISKFFGIFFMLFLSSPVWGNLIAGAIFVQENVNHFANLTEDEISAVLSLCGADNCPLGELPENFTAAIIEPPEFSRVLLLVCVMIGITLVGILLVAVFVERMETIVPTIKPEVSGPEPSTRTVIWRLLRATGRQAARRKQLLLIPITIYTGLQQAFILAEFTFAYVGCALGIGSVSYCVMTFGVVGAVVSLSLGPISEMLDRAVIFITGAVVHIVTLIALMFWAPDPSQEYLFYVIPSIWSIGDAVFQSQINTLYGYLFRENSEAAFANYRMWESVGFIIGYSYSAFLCVSSKIIVLLILLTIAVVCYCYVDYLQRRQDRKTAPPGGATSTK